MFVKSSYSNGNANCVEVFVDVDRVFVADSKQKASDRPVIGMSYKSWLHLTDQLLDRVCVVRDLDVTTVVHADGCAEISDGVNTLSFTKCEWDAFIAGVQAGEFNVSEEIPVVHK